MAVISDIEQRVQERLEEATDHIGSFWDVANELRPLIVEAMFEATVLTGEPQVRQTGLTQITPNQTFQPSPSGAVAVLRMETDNGDLINRCSMWDLDRHYPGWENATGPDVMYWFPYGLTQFGVYPQVTAEVDVIMTVVEIPVTAVPPYTGAETIDFQSEYFEAFQDYAAHVARIKEGGDIMQQSIPVLNRFLAKMEELSRFAYRKGSLRFSMGPAGSGSQIVPVVGK